MNELKQGCQTTLLAVLDGVALTDVAQVDFLFKQQPSTFSDPLKTSQWLSDGTGDAYTDNGRIVIPWSAAETYRFDAGEPFYMDTRITMKQGNENPLAPILCLTMEPTLFGETSLQD